MDLLRRSVATLVALAAMPMLADCAFAQSASAPDLTAAYLTNFVKFTVWPAEALPAEAPLVLCVEGSAPVADALEEMTRSQKIAGHPLMVRRVKADDPLQACHVLYAASLARDRADRLLRTTATLPILTVSDSADFTRRGGIVHFFVEKERLRFAVNPDAANRAGLRISAKLLSLSTIVRGDRP
jgi:hypothetical protein